MITLSHTYFFLHRVYIPRGTVVRRQILSAVTPMYVGWCLSIGLFSGTAQAVVLFKKWSRMERSRENCRPVCSYCDFFFSQIGMSSLPSTLSRYTYVPKYVSRYHQDSVLGLLSLIDGILGTRKAYNETQLEKVSGISERWTEALC